MKKFFKKIFKKLFPSKERRAFNKMHRRHRKELIKHAKKTNEWDWDWLHNSIIMQIRHMHEFYSNGNNVWQADESKFQIIEQLKYILYLQSEIDRMQDENYGIKYVHKDGIIETIYADNYMEIMDGFKEKEQQLYEELYSFIGKYLRWWWD